ncbi:MAG: sensor histidine kinase [Treponema sp.]|nr:sensor histidine kinase [Treponema sp.]
MPKLKLSIRKKLLLFYIASISAVAMLDLYVQFVTYHGVQEFDFRLNRYHQIHRLRLDLAQQFQRIERQLREGNIPDEAQIDQEQRALYFTLSQLESHESESKNVYFNLRATRRGLDAYFIQLGKGIAARGRKETAWYQDIAAAGRIGAYVDSYLAAMLSDAMQAGSDLYQNLVERIHRIRAVTLGLLGVFIILFGLAAIAFSSAIAKPIHRLAEASQRIAQGDLDVPEIITATGDEIDTLASAFNTMSQNIKRMVQDLRDKAELERKLREEDLALKEAQFINLQDQIRPHFLFNAINTIARTALFEGARETEQLTLALGALFRYALASPQALVTIEEEASIVSEYLKFQSLRFGKRLQWKVNIQKSARSVLIPRFTLQPFVENAVRHGIEPLEQGGSVELTINRRGNMVYAKIKDTGKGMSLNKIDKLHEGLGISNVRRRLQICYGDRASLQIKSTLGQGTTVSIAFPADTTMEVHLG